MKGRLKDRKMIASWDYSKVLSKKAKEINNNYPLALSLSTKYGNLSKERIKGSLRNLRKSWSKPRPLHEQESGDNPILMQDSSRYKRQSKLFNRVNGNRSIREGRRFANYSNIFSEGAESLIRFKSPELYTTTKKSIDSDLSWFTIKENNIVNEKLEKLKTIEKEQIEKKNNKDAITTNWSELLRATTKQLKNIQYMVYGQIGSYAKRASGGNTKEYHITLYPNFPEKIDIIEDTSVYCMLQWNGSASPAKVQINSRPKGGKLTVYWSLKNSLPNKNNWELAFKNPKKFYVYDDDKAKGFKNEFIYFRW